MLTGNQQRFLPCYLAEELHRIEVILEKKGNVRKMIPHYLLWTEEERGALVFAKCYSEILERNMVFSEEKAESYFLGLNFPKEDSPDNSFHLFYDSARQRANTRNRFCGVFMINLENWASASARSPRFESLLEYTKENESTIRFVFCLPATSKDAAYIAGRLNEEIGVKCFDIPLPDIELANRYVESELKEMSIVLPPPDGTIVRKMIKEVTGSSQYKGYETLDRIVKQLGYASMEGEERALSETVARIKEGFSVKEETRRIGFL